MIHEIVKQVVDIIVESYGYEAVEIPGKNGDLGGVFLTIGDKVPRIIISRNDKFESEVDIAFSVSIPPSEAALIIEVLHEEEILYNLTKDFYMTLDKKLLYGREAEQAFLQDIILSYKDYLETGKISDTQVEDIKKDIDNTEQLMSEYEQNGFAVIRTINKTLM